MDEITTSEITSQLMMTTVETYTEATTTTETISLEISKAYLGLIMPPLFMICGLLACILVLMLRR